MAAVASVVSMTTLLLDSILVLVSDLGRSLYEGILLSRRSSPTEAGGRQATRTNHYGYCRPRLSFHLLSKLTAAALLPAE